MKVDFWLFPGAFLPQGHANLRSLMLLPNDNKNSTWFHENEGAYRCDSLMGTATGVHRY